jgi:ankyrin repeat protein
MKRIARGAFASAVMAVALSSLLQAAADAPVADAAMRGDQTAVRALLKKGADVNQSQGDGMTALHWAAASGDTGLMETLLYAGANVRATTRLGGYAPMHVASQSGHALAIATLVKGGADVNMLTSTGATPLMMAALSGKAEAARALLDAGADINVKDKVNEETALMFAAAHDRADIVRLLVERGADLKATAKVIDRGAGPPAPGEVALREAQRGGGRSQNRGEDGRGAAQGRPANDAPGVTRPYTFNELIGKVGGLTALHFAARQGSAQSVRALVEGGADVNQISPADQASPLLIATVNGQFDVAMYLLEKGANPNLASDAGATPLYAALNVHWAPKSFYPQPRAHLQQKASYLDYMKALLDRGADPNARVQRKIWYTSYNFDNLRIDESGATPFWRAAYASDLEAMKMLVSYGADPNIRTTKSAGRNFRDDGTREGGDTTPRALPAGAPSITPLMAAAGAGYGEGYAGNAHRFAPTGMLAAVKYLVDELGVDVNAVDADGTTAMHHAAARGDNEMILYLVQKGADVTVVNRRGQSTADMANGPVQRIQPFPETLALLEKLGATNHHKCVSC